jgi:hypothetical protein
MARDYTGREAAPVVTDDRNVPAAGSQAKGADPKQKTYVEIILDSSGSMLEYVNGEAKIDTAKKMIKVAIQSIDSGNSITALRTFGHRNSRDCKDIELRLGFYEKNLAALNERILEINPVERGMTPLARALEQASENLKQHPGPKKIIAVTDGTETCGGDPCKVADKIISENKDVKIYLLTYGAKKEDDFAELSCMPKVNNAKTPEGFSDALASITQDALDTEQTIMVKGPKPEAWATAFDTADKSRTYRFVSSLGTNLPPGTFDVVVDYEPPVTFRAVKLAKGERKKILVKGQGQVRLGFPSPQVRILAENLVTGKRYSFKPNERAVLDSGRYNVLATTPTGLAFQFPSVAITPRGRSDLPMPNWGVLYVTGTGAQPYDLFPISAPAPNAADSLIPEEHRPVKKVTAFEDSLGFFMTNQEYVVEAGRYKVITRDGRQFPDVTVKQGKRTDVGR